MTNSMFHVEPRPNRHGGCHEEGCPEDDTCDCRGKATNDLVTEAITEAEE
jgi:hypothetical protein